MFCKWCGGNLTSSDTKCRRCGKEVPALSDCGGFYDLVKKPVKIPTDPVPPIHEPVNPSPKPEQPKEVTPAGNKKSIKTALLGIAILNVAGFVLGMLMLLIIGGKVNRYASDVNKLQNDLRTVSEKIESLAETTEPVVIEPEVEKPVPVLAEQNISFTVKIDSEESAQGVEANLDLGEYKDTALISYGMDEESKKINSIGYTLEEAESALLLTLEWDNNFYTKNLRVRYTMDGIAFGLSYIPETCRWQYRFGGDADWTDIPADTFDQTDRMGVTGLSIGETEWQSLTAGSDGEIEFRCEIIRTNTRNGSLTIVMEGIKFS